MDIIHCFLGEERDPDQDEYNFSLFKLSEYSGALKWNCYSIVTIKQKKHSHSLRMKNYQCNKLLDIFF